MQLILQNFIWPRLAVPAVFGKSLFLLMLLSHCAVAFAVDNIAAKKPLSADQHYAAAKKLAAEDEENIGQDHYAEVVFHIDQAIAKGYKNRKEARLFLQERLRMLGGFTAGCNGVYKDSKDPAIQKQCNQARSAIDRAVKMTAELYKDYPDDARVILLYAVEINQLGAHSKEAETLLRKAATIAPQDPDILGELAQYTPVTESKQLFADYVAFTQKDEFISHSIRFAWDTLRQRGCAASPDLDGIIDSIPRRYDGAGPYVDPKYTVAVKQLAEDHDKLLALKKRFVTALRQHRCG